jgi:geranylgeranylglycerol-phosphate geranylgeranyltransferase
VVKATAGTTMGLAVGIVRIVRLRTTLSAPVLTLIGWIDLSQHTHFSILRVMLSLFSSFTLMAFCQVFNDILDRDLDAEAKPNRPIPAELITVPQAHIFAIALALVSICAAAFTSVDTFCYAAFCMVLAVLYSARLKNTILLGNLAVAVVSCAMFSYGSSTASSPWGRELIGTLSIFLYILGNELYKTALDSREDAQYGLRTIATIYGLRVTARVVAVVAGALLALIAVAGITRLAPVRFVLAAVVVIGVPVVCGAVRANVSREIAVETFARSLRFWRFAWVPGTLTLLLLR